MIWHLCLTFINCGFEIESIWCCWNSSERVHLMLEIEKRRSGNFFSPKLLLWKIFRIKDFNSFIGKYFFVQQHKILSTYRPFCLLISLFRRHKARPAVWQMNFQEIGVHSERFWSAKILNSLKLLNCVKMSFQSYLIQMHWIKNEWV